MEEEEKDERDDTRSLHIEDHKDKTLQDPIKQAKELEEKEDESRKGASLEESDSKRTSRMPLKWWLTKLPKEQFPFINDSYYESIKKKGIM